MSEKCILDLKQAMSEAGLSEEGSDIVMAEIDSKADLLASADRNQKSRIYKEIFNKARKESVRRKIRKAADIERVLEVYNSLMDHIDSGYDVHEHTRNLADGNMLARIKGSANGYSNVKNAVVQNYHAKILHKLQDAGGVDEHGNKNYIYEDMWNKYHEAPDVQNTLDILSEINANNNKAVAESMGKEYDGPEPGHTGNTFATIIGEAISAIQQEHNTVLSAYGLDHDMIEHYFLPQRHFAENMQPDFWSKNQAYVFGYTSKQNGKKYFGRKAQDALKQDMKTEWIEFTKGNIDIPETIRNLNKVAYAEKAPKIRDIMEFANKIKDTHPATAKALVRAIDIVRKDDIAGVDAVFSTPLTKRHVSWERKLKEKAKLGNDVDRAVANELLASPTILKRLKSIIITKDTAIDIDRALGNIYEGIVNPFDKLGVFDQLGKNQYQRASAERVLVYKDVNSWMNYQNKYGHANLPHAVLSMIDNFGKREAYAKVFGSNASATYAQAQEMARATLQKRRMEATTLEEIGKYDNYINQLSKETSTMELYIRYIEGEFDRMSNSTAYRFIQWYMQAGKMVLGQAMFPAIGDINNRLDVLSRVGLARGEDYIPGKPLVDTLSYIQAAPIKKMFRDNQALVHSFTGMFSGMASRLTPAGMPEMSSAKGNIYRTIGQKYRRFTDTYLAWTFVNQIDEAGRMAVADQVGTYLGNVAVNGGTWASLGKEMRAHLDMAGIGEAEWEVYKKRGVYKYGKDRENWAISAWQLEKNITREDVAGILGIDVSILTELDFIKGRRDLAAKYDEFIVAFANTAIVTPNIETRAFLQGGGSVNTAMRGVRAMFTEFLSYPTRIMFDLHRSVALDFTKHSGLRTTQPYWRVAKLAALGLVYGYMAMSLKDIANRRELRNPLDADTIRQALTIGGGLGLLGESAIEFAEMRSARELYRWLGPSGSQLLQTADDIRLAVKGELTEQKIADSLYRQIPNLAWTKWAIDKYFAAEMYKFFGATYEAEAAKMRHQEKFGTFEDFVQLFTND